MSKSEFARRQLKKHGWKEGAGLGKDEHGRADPIKVSLKMDKAGVGHDPGKEFTDHWWLRVFNEAAQKIGNNEKKNKSDNPMSEEEKAKSIKEQRKKNFYKGFVQSATLTNGVEEKTVCSDSSDEDEKDTSKLVSVPTLEDIHKFCGGATGHKAASFGIRMEGKIKRASHHEKQFEEKFQVNGIKDERTQESLENSSLERNVKKKRQKKKKKEKEAMDEKSVGSNLNEDKTAKKRKVRVLSPADETKDQELEDIPKKKLKKKKKIKTGSKGNNSESEVNDFSEHLEDSSKEFPKNTDKIKKRRNLEKKLELKEDSQSQDVVESIDENSSNSCKKKKKKKKKSHQ